MQDTPRLTPAVHEMLRDLHKAIDWLDSVADRRIKAKRHVEATRAELGSEAWFAVKALASTEQRAEAAVLALARLIAAATPAHAPRASEARG